MTRGTKKFFKIILYALCILVAIIGILLLLLRMPSVQTRIAREVTSILSKQLKTEIGIDAVAINFIDNATIKGVYLEDLQKDTLVYAGDIVVDIGFFKLLNNEIIIESLTLGDAVIKVKQAKDSIFNFQ